MRKSVGLLLGGLFATSSDDAPPTAEVERAGTEGSAAAGSREAAATGWAAAGSGPARGAGAGACRAAPAASAALEGAAEHTSLRNSIRDNRRVITRGNHHRWAWKCCVMAGGQP